MKFVRYISFIIVFITSTSIYADPVLTFVCPDSSAIQKNFQWFERPLNWSQPGKAQIKIGDFENLGAEMTLMPPMDSGIKPDVTFVSSPGIPVVLNKESDGFLYPYPRSYFACLYKINKTSLPILAIEQMIVDQDIKNLFPDTQGNTYYWIGDWLPYAQCSISENKITCISTKN